MPADPDVPVSLALDAWLGRLAEPNGAPGGGSAAGVMMAVAAALLHMVCGYTGDDPRAAEAERRVRELRGGSLDAAREDGVRSVALGEALAYDGPDRSDRVREAAVAAAASSARLADLGVALVDELRVVAEVGNPNLVADTGVAAQALRAGLGAALINLRANTRLAGRHAGDDEDAAERAGADAGERAERAIAEVDAVLAALPVG